MPYPTDLDNLAASKVDATVAAVDHPSHHNALAAAINALQAKIGVGSDTPLTPGDVLTVTASGVTVWQSTQTPSVVVGAPTAPTNLTATPGDGIVSLTWSGATLATSYDVYRRPSTASVFTLISPSEPTNSFTDNTVVNSTTYVYRVRSVNTLATSFDSPEATATPVAAAPAATVPAAPTAVTIATSGTTITVSWMPSATAAYYTLARSTTPGGTYTTVPGASTLTQLSFTDSGLTNSVRYFYVVYAVNVVGSSAASAEVNAIITVVTATTWAGEVAARSPALWWRLGEASGTTFADTSGNSHPGTGTGTGITYSVPSGLADGSTGITLDGSTGTISAGDILDFAGTASQTIVALVKPDATTAPYGRIISKESYNSGTGRDDGWGLQLGLSLNPQYVRYLSSGTDTYADGPSLTAGAWALLTATYDGSNQKLYVNDTLVATTPSTLSLANHAQVLRVGAGTTSTSTLFNYLKGSVDEIILYTTALTLADVQALYAAATTTGGGTGGGTVTTAPPAPTGLAAVASGNRLDLSWNAVGSASTYEVRYGTATGAYTVTAPPTTSTSMAITGLVNGTTYYLTVLGINSAGRGVQAAEVTGVPAAGAVPTLTLQQQIDATATSGTCTIQAGTYRELTTVGSGSSGSSCVITRPMTVIVPGTVTIKGSDRWTTGVVTNAVAASWAKQAGNTWVSNKFVTNSFSMDSNAVGDPRQTRPYQVFVNGFQLASVDQNSAVGPMQFKRNSFGQIEMGVDPAGKEIEVTVRKSWFDIQAADVTVRGVSITDRGTLEHAVNNYQRGGGNLAGINGTWHRCTWKWLQMGYCHTAVIALYGGEDHSVIGCRIYNGDNVGIDLGNDFSTVIYGYTMTDNEIHDCGNLGNPSWHCGGVKATVRGGSVAHPAVWLRNDIHHCRKAFWIDTKCGGTIIGGATLADANLFHHNQAGVHIEVNNGAQSGADPAGILFQFNKIYGNTQGSAVIVDTCRKVLVKGNLFAWNSGPDLDMHHYQGRPEIAAYIGAGPTDYVVDGNFFVVDHTSGSNAGTRAHMALVWRDDANSSGTHGTMTAASNTAAGVNTFAFMSGGVLTAENASAPRFEYIGSGPTYYVATHSLTAFAATKYGTGSVYFASTAAVQAFLVANNLPVTPS